ncbi:glycosyltransferase family A protein [Paenibacillus sp. J2TS4]|uniref:glycosyltransferase family A protein n=1 Tax=Paenibacillus sp. J2TS4 TaxID=2807194 RepID=UPI001B1EAFB2|nr:glycosyltransferase family A protein [Paenibacillus sp. J2TS4]GIP35605.1 hypothetical protein J2TS4_48150 [Paenibacillus sp. J2TS4]
MPLLSIIIPVYNVEKYINDCLESILNQTFSDYEIILVDNASTDNSGRICDKYAANYTSIKAIHLKSNLLPAGARNAGLHIATGEYVHFCDSDDVYVKDAFSHITNLLKGSSPSAIIGQFICMPEKGAFVCNDIQLDPKIIENSNSSDMAKYLLSLPNLLCTPWRLIVKRDMLVSNHIMFPEGCHSEDEEWFPRVICCSDSFSLLTEPFYCYRPRATGSITSIKTYANSKSHLTVALNLLRFLKEKKYTDNRCHLIYSRVRFLLGLFATRVDTLDTEQLHESSDILERNRDILAMLSDIPEKIDLYNFINNYGEYLGLCLYRTFTIEKTLELIYGKEQKDIYIFPTGYNGEGTARILQQAGYHVKGFLDNSEFKDGSQINGLPVSKPGILNNRSSDSTNDIFVIVSTQSPHAADSITRQLKDFGLSDSQFASRIY